MAADAAEEAARMAADAAEASTRASADTSLASSIASVLSSLNTEINNTNADFTSIDLRTGGITDNSNNDEMVLKSGVRFQVGREGTVPAEYKTGNQAQYDGSMFFLAGPGELNWPGYKFYFCEGGTWHPSPFLADPKPDTDGDGFHDSQEEHNPNPGCNDDAATNYDPTATELLEGSCEYGIPGCTDPMAINYDPSATVDDGSCAYDGGGGGMS